MRVWQNVRVFLSSTFRDMHAERDHLVNVVFPRLRERLVAHRVELTDIDLRWGITAEQSENEQVLGLCLAEIDRCRPYFLGFLGHRYGWAPAALPADARAAFPWIDRHPGASVTELEVRHGVLNGGPSRALFCLRDRPALDSIPEPTRSVLFAERDGATADRLERLKDALRGSGQPVRDYTGRWDGEAYDRPTRSHGRLTGLHAFGEVVEEWLWGAIDAELGLAARAVAKPDPLDEEADFHERFMEARLRVHVGRERDERALHAFALAGDEIPCVVTGPSGSGKSSLLARFVHTFREARPEVVTLAHFVGASATTSLSGMLGRMAAELKRRLGLEAVIPDDPAGRVTAFLGLLASVPAGRRVVLVLDALNQLDDGGGAETLHWLPERLPAHVELIASSVTGPGRPPRVLSAFGERDVKVLEVPPLTEDDRRDILAAVPRLAAKSLDARQRAALLGNPATQNPLYLLTALEELRVYGSFATLDDRIAALPRDGDSVTALFEQVFARLEDEFDRDLVERVLSLLACARRGLSDAEVKELTADCPSGADVFAVLRQLRPYLMRRSGHWDFYHASVRRAVLRHYLKSDPDAERLHASAEERRTRQRLVKYYRPQKLSGRGIEELPWQLAQMRDWQGLWQLLAELPFLNAAWDANEFEVREYWATVERESSFAMIDAYREAVSRPGEHAAEHLWNLATLLQTTGHLDEGSALRGHLIAEYRDTDEGRYAANLGGQAVILNERGDLDGAMLLHKEQEAICRRLNDLARLGGCLGNQALILRARGDLDGAMRLHEEEEATCRRLNDPAGLAACLGNQAVILNERGDLDGAMLLHKEQEAICRRLNDPGGLQGCLGNQAAILQDRGDLDGAMLLHEEEEAICRRLNDPGGLQRSLGNQAAILRARGDLDGAMLLHKQQEAICRRLNRPNSLAISLANQAALLASDRDRPAEALPLAEQALALAERHGYTALAGQIRPILDAIRQLLS